MGLILSIVSGLIVSANLLVAAAVLKLLLRKRSQSWCFVLNLALADFLVGVAITGVAIENFSVDGDAQKLCELVADDPSAQASPPGEKRHCLMRMTFVMSPSTASIMSMFFISLDRYAAIKMPLRYSRLSGKATAAASLLALWISSLLVGFLPGENGALVPFCSEVTHPETLCSPGAAAADGILRRILLPVRRRPEGVHGRLQHVLLPALLCVRLHLPGHPEDRVGPPQADRADQASLFQAGPPAGAAPAAAEEPLLGPRQSPEDGGGAGRLRLAPLVSVLRGGHGGAAVQQLQALRRGAEPPLALGALQLAGQPSGVRLLAEGAAVGAGAHVLLLRMQDGGRRTSKCCRKTQPPFCGHGSCL